MKNVLSIQSWVAFGHVGNASAMFPLQRLGVEVWAVNTVQFSNHTGYGKWRGTVFTGDMVREIVTGIEGRGVLGSCDGVLSGYIGEAILEAVAKVKAANPNALYCCDPVIGDVGCGVFVRPGIPEFMREHAVPAADLITPNQVELEVLAGRQIHGSMISTPRSTPRARSAPVSSWSPACSSRTRRRQASTWSPRTIDRAGACERRCCRCRSTGPETRCRRSARRPRQCSVCSGARRNLVRARS